MKAACLIMIVASALIAPRAEATTSSLTMEIGLTIVADCRSSTSAANARPSQTRKSNSRGVKQPSSSTIAGQSCAPNYVTQQAVGGGGSPGNVKVTY